MRFNWQVMSRLCLFILAVPLFLFSGLDSGVGYAAQLDNQHLQQQKEPLHMTVILERMYLDGEVSEEVVKEASWSLENFWAKYDQWQLTNIDESKLVFRKKVDDISPLLKANGYFGITHDGILTIFNGRPDRYRIIQSFFQIDIKRLESKKQEELLHGIPIKTKDRYVKVLETFKPYSTKEEQKN
jgi:forespore regulator of the sigma-K checkpoint